MENNFKSFNIQQVVEKMNLFTGQTVADFGCGQFGFFVFPLAKAVGMKGRVYAIDVIKDYLDKIKKEAQINNLPQVEIIRANLEIWQGTKIESASVDSVIIINVLFQSAKRLEILREAARILKSGGRLLVIDWKRADSPYGPPLELRVNFESLKLAVLKLGFDLEEEFEASEYNTGIIFTKIL